MSIVAQNRMTAGLSLNGVGAVPASDSNRAGYTQPCCAAGEDAD